MEQLREDRVALAASRSNIYNFLSIIYKSEPEEKLIQLIRDKEIQITLKALGLDIQHALGEKTIDQFLEDLVLEYTRLFIGPGPHISPHESVHRGDESNPGLLWGESTVDVKRFIEWLGLSYDPDYKGIPDHVAVEFELMQKITEGESKAWLGCDVDSARTCLEYEGRFLRDHLLKWIPDFCNEVMNESKTNFYQEMARFTKDYLYFEDEQIKSQLTEVSKKA